MESSLTLSENNLLRLNFIERLFSRDAFIASVKVNAWAGILNSNKKVAVLMLISFIFILKKRQYIYHYDIYNQYLYHVDIVFF